MKGTLFAGLLLAIGSAAKHKSKVKYDNVELKDLPQANINELLRSSGSFKDAKKAEFGAIKGAQ